MKTHLRLAVIAVGLTPLLPAPSFSLLAAAAVGDNPPERTVVARDAHRRIWQRDNLITTADGKLVNQPKRVIEIATGLHYREETGEWKESRDEIEIVADGAAATKGPHKVHLNGNINSFGAVTITLPDNRMLKSHPLCVAFTDPATGKSAIIAEVRDSDGILLPPNQVLYPDAFSGGGVRADIRVSYTKAGFESDVILRTRLPAPAKWSLDEETVLLEVWHEFPEAPEPIKTWRALGTLSDEELNFGSMRIGRGAAFALEAPLNRMSAVPVAKTWMTLGRPARTFLIESVSYKSLRKELDQLPPLQAANQPLNPGPAPELLASREAGLVKLVPPHEGASIAVRMALDMKAIDLRKGLVLDYVLLAGDTNDFRFQRDTTYFISESVNFFGDVVFEPTVVKISSAGDYMIQTWSNVVFETDDFHPVIFTSSNDRTVGEDVSVGTEMYYYGALSNTRSDLEFKNLRISYAKYGLHAYSMKVRHAQFVHCPMALLIDQNTGTEVDNTLFYDCGTAFGGFNYTAVGRHVTVNKCASLGGGAWGDPAACHLTLTNSLLVSVTNSGGITLTTNYTASNSLSTVFQTVGAGAHYLASVSSYRNAGTTNLPAWLLADLMQRTTFPPVVLASNKITTNFVMVPRVARCTDLPDLGYHYAPLDYVYGSNVLTNATLTIERGTVLGTFTPGTNSEGLTLHGNATLVTHGDPMNPVRIVRYNMVQEQANDAWSSVYPGASIRTAATTVTPSPTARFSFTDFSQPVYDSAHFVSYPNNLGPFYFDNCTFSGGKLWSFAAACAFTNCLWLRVDGYFSDDAGTQLSRFYNNSFVGGTYAFTMVATSCWSFFNNAFYTTNIYASGDHNHGYNAYLSGGARIGAYASNDVILSGAVFHAGPLGRYYLTNSSPLTNAGSMRATNAGLYHFTTTVDQKPETNSIVDIGFHYIALASTNAAAQPLDRDGDGVPDFEEDTNGNGAQDVGETSLTRQDSPFLPRDYEPLGPSSRRTPLVISEILYSSTNKFVELYNTHYLPQRLDGFMLTNLNNLNATAYVFPSNSTIAPGAFLLMTGADGNGTAIVGLGPKSKIQLRNALGAVLLEVHYDDKAPWPVEANGTGHSLVLARPSYGENDPRAWAASEKRGGSPGYAETNRVDFLRAVKINEFLASPPTGEVDTIELYNACNRPVDISGCYLARTNNGNITLADYKIPAGTLLPPRGFARFLGNQSFTFPIDNSSFDSLLLANPDRTRVVDAVKYDPQDAGISTGRTPDGASTFSELSVRSAGGTNAARLVRNVVINEIMYRPPSSNAALEYVELYNRGSTNQSLASWKIDGIGFTFSSATILASNYVVVAADTNALTLAFPSRFTNGVNLFGPFSGDLGNGGERLTLVNSSGVVVDEVTYSDGGRWGKWSDGGGASLELVDARADHRLAANWADSSPPSTAEWTSLSVTGLVMNGDGNAGNRLELMMLGAGECLVDDVEVISTGGGNLVSNGDFEQSSGFQIVNSDWLMANPPTYCLNETNGLEVCTPSEAALPPGWMIQGNHDLSDRMPDGGTANSACLHVRASGRGDYLANRIFRLLTSSLSLNSTCIIRAKVKWLRGHPELLFRISGNYFEAPALMIIPTALGTPGVANSQSLSNAAPAISEVRHWPPVPTANELVTISGRAHDPDGVTNFVVKYRVDPATNYTTLALRDDGTGGDSLANDGVFAATLPAQSAANIAFIVEATDALGAKSRFPKAEMLFPTNDMFQRECVVRIGDGIPNSIFGTYRLWLSTNVFKEWQTRHRAHNSPLDATFVNGSRVIYNAGTKYAGSLGHANNFTSPIGPNCGYALEFPPDDRFLGASGLNLDWDASDPAHSNARMLQSEQLAMAIANRLELPNHHRRFVELYVHGVKRTGGANAFEDTQGPNSDFIEEWYPNHAEDPFESGQLFGINLWERSIDFPPSGNFFSGSLERVNRSWPGITNASLDIPRYRIMFEPKALGGKTESFDTLSNLVIAVENTNSSSYLSNVETRLDYEQWMRVFAYERGLGNFDSYGYHHGQNMFAYHDLSNGLKWNLLTTDFDTVFATLADAGVGPTDDPFTNAGLIVTREPRLADMRNIPLFRRAFWRCLYDLANSYDGILLTNTIWPIFYGHDSVLRANGYTPPATTGATVDVNWIAKRQTNLLARLTAVRPALRFLTINDTTFSTSNVTITGVAPVEVKGIKLNGAIANLTWTTDTNWSLTTTLTLGTNNLQIVGYDRKTNSLPPRDVGGYTTNIFVKYTP